MITVTTIDQWLTTRESERLEFKEARNSFNLDKAIDYCAALANEGGGCLVLGVTDRLPRRVVGSMAFRGSSLDQVKRAIAEQLRLRIEIDEVAHPAGRVVVFHVPARPVGMPIRAHHVYWMRCGESLVSMTEDRLRTIFDEAGPDYTATTCASASMADLAPAAVDDFRSRWQRKSGNAQLAELSRAQLLADAGLLIDGQITLAALILFAAPDALRRHLPQAEVIFEYRSAETEIRFQHREEFRRGFFLWYDDLWRQINARNDRQHFQDGLFVWDIDTFNEIVIREAVLNAVAHRDYRRGGSVFVRQFPRRLEIVSPGGFPDGITAENILTRQNPRNRLIAESFARCGLIERSGQGANLMFKTCISESKRRPDFTDTDAHQVCLNLHGEVRDAAFLRFLEHFARTGEYTFSLDDLLVLDLVHTEQRIPESLKPQLAHLAEIGAVEKVGRTRGQRYILARQFFEMIGQKGAYTRRKGLDEATNVQLLLKHIRDNKSHGSPVSDLCQVLPHLSRDRIQALLRRMKNDRQIHATGRGRGSRWFPSNA